jgi:GDP-4-dehydro-6-deoxy-D-mannose reductase
MDRPTLVTGAAGFAGSHLLDLLSGTGRLVAWHRPSSASPARRPDIEWHGVDLLNRDAVVAALAALKPATVYHCAGAAHVGASWSRTTETLAVNVRGTHHVIEALRDCAPDARVLIPSSGMVYSPSARALREDDPLVPSSPYALSKLAQELVGRGNGDGPRVFIARPFNHVGPRQSASFSASGFARRIAEIERGAAPPAIPVGNLESRRDLTDVRDTVRAYRLIVERGTPERPYNVCTGRAPAIREVLDLLLAKSRVRITVTVDPARYRPNDLPLLLGDPSRIHDELGWTPAIALEQTIDDLLNFWRAQA